MKSSRSLRALGAALLLASAATVHAWPPAPGFIVHGTVRDPWGWVIDEPDARIRFRAADGRIVAEGRLSGAVSVHGNYQVVLPLDHQRGGPLYRGSAAGVGAPFSIEVLLDGRIWFPLAGPSGTPVTESGGMLRLDLVLGEDSDDDGLPDLWEQWQLEAAGMPAWDLALLSGEGDTDGDGMSNRMEFVAGTWALLAFDRLALEFVSMADPAWNELRFPAVFDKTYILERSADLLTWERAAFGLWEERAALRTEWRATDTLDLTVQTPSETGRRWFYRLGVR